jgi:hypothetical protein
MRQNEGMVGPGISDTHPSAAQVQLALLRRATIARRFQLARALSEWTIQLSRRGIREMMPAASELELGLRFVELHYGADLAARLSAYLARRATT